MNRRDSSIPSNFRFQELDTKECLELLRTKRIGRIVWCDKGEPQSLPVNYFLDKDRILFRTSPYAVIAQIGHLHSAAFEVDDFDEYVGTGWSILVTGTPAFVEEPSDLPKAFADRPSPWAPGERNLYIHVLPRKITGRRVVSEV